MKKLLLSLAITLGIIHIAWADDYTYLNLTSNSTVQSIALQTVRKISFESDNVVVTTIDGTATATDLASLLRITFTDIPVFINDQIIESPELRMEGGDIVTQGQGKLYIFNASGVLVRQRRVNETPTKTNVHDLNRGLYIAHFNNSTIKFIR